MGKFIFSLMGEWSYHYSYAILFFFQLFKYYFLPLNNNEHLEIIYFKIENYQSSSCLISSPDQWSEKEVVHLIYTYSLIPTATSSLLILHSLPSPCLQLMFSPLLSHALTPSISHLPCILINPHPLCTQASNVRDTAFEPV